MNQPPDHDGVPAAFYFSVSFGDAPGVADCQFQEVSGIGVEMALDDVREEGEHRFVHRLPKVSPPTALVLKRGVASATASMLAWCRDVLEGGLAQPVQTRQLRVTLLDATAQPLRAWRFEQAWPVRREIGADSPINGETAIEMIQLAYQSVQREI